MAPMQLATFNKLVMIKHTLIGLPWVVSGAALPFFQQDINAPSAMTFLWMVIAFAGARVAGMNLNRLIDRHIDAANPRTKNRALPAGEATIVEVMGLSLIGLLAFVLACACINLACMLLTPVIIFALVAYSFTKRFSRLCHFAIGSILFFVPVMSWAALTNSYSIEPVLMGLGLLFSVAASDIVYSFMDAEWDRTHKVYSLPSTLGLPKALLIARGCLVLAVLLFTVLGFMMDLPPPYFLATITVAGLFITFHRQIDLNDPQTFEPTFLKSNVYAGFVMMAGLIGGLLWERMFSA